MQLKLLILGGYGTFGGRLAQLLADEAGLTIVIAGRSQAKAEAFCRALPTTATLVPAIFDRNGDVEAQIKALTPDVVVDATGPFQNYGDTPYRVIQACLALGIHYLDLADGSDFVKGVSRFDAEAKARGVFILSGFSSFPVLTAAVVRELAQGLRQVRSIKGGIAPSPYAGVGENVTRSWHLLAEGSDGPLIPSMAIEAIIRHMLTGKTPAPGARAATHDVTLADYKELFKRRTIYTGRRDTPPTDAPLYRRVLGDAWLALPPAIRDMHELHGTKAAEGMAKVERGKNRMAQWIAGLFGFPRAGENIPVRMDFSLRSGKEHWRRTFAGKSFLSIQSEGKGRYKHLVCERFGLFTFGLAVVVNDGKLQLVVRRWNLLGLPMPFFLAPGGYSFESEEAGKFHFHVEIALPVVGLLVRYQGWLVSKNSPDLEEKQEKIELNTKTFTEEENIDMPTPTTAVPDPDAKITAFAGPVWNNAHWAKNALDLYDGIAFHAEAVNKTNHNHFFGIVQQLALEGAVVHICKLYDTSNKDYEKHTVPSLLNFFASEFNPFLTRGVRTQDLLPLEISEAQANAIINKLDATATYTEGSQELIAALLEKMPSRKNSAELDKIFVYRNKIGTHQERLSDTLRETLRTLPSLEKMQEFTQWAENFCMFAMSALSTHTTFVPAAFSARMAALNVLAKVLDKKFDEKMDYAEYRKFYGIPE